MKPLYILKIGGSVVTFKDKPGFSVQTELLEKIAKHIKKALNQKKFDLILIHGAGAAGHQLAKKHNHAQGTLTSSSFMGALESRVANQKLNLAINEIFNKSRLKTLSVHTASTIMYKNNKLNFFNKKIIKETLRQNCIPLLYGEMVFDKDLGMAICSGDVIASYLSKKLKAKKIFFASDIDGIFDKDPHINKDAKLIKKIKIDEIEKKSQISESHNIDTTGGLLGKIKNITKSHHSNLEKVEIFNGFKPINFEKALLGKKFDHTEILLKK
jgi:isopentenyl phosphate kinase